MKSKPEREINVEDPGSSDLVLSFQPKVSDYRNLVYFYSFGQKAVQSIILGVAWTGCLMVLVLEKAEILGELEPLTHNCLRLVCVLLPLLVITAEYNVFQFKKNNKSWLAAERTIAFSDRGISLSDPSNHKKKIEKWGDFLKIQETGKLFVISRSPTENFIIPKRAIKHPETLEQLRILFSSKLGNKFLRNG